MGKIQDVEAAVLRVFDHDPCRWFSATELAHLVCGWDEAPSPSERVKEVEAVRRALKRLKNTGLVFLLGRLASERPGPGVPPYQLMWGPPEAVIAHARLVERQLGARWVDAELLQAARDALLARSDEALARRAELPLPPLPSGQQGCVARGA